MNHQGVSDYLDITQILGSAEGLRALMTAGDSLGLAVMGSTDSATAGSEDSNCNYVKPIRVINFGPIVIDKLPSPTVPIGYEDSADDYRILSRKCFIISDVALTLTSIEIYPRNFSDGPVVSVQSGLHESSPLMPGVQYPFVIQFKVNKVYEGTLARFIVMKFHLVEKVSLAQIRHTHLARAIKIEGSILSSKYNGLSSNAKSFYPRHLRNCFYEPGYVIISPVDMPNFTRPPPLFYKTIRILQWLRDALRADLPGDIYPLYESYLTSNRLPELMKILKIDCSGSGLSHIYSLLKLISIEEIQMAMDIQSHDIYSSKLTFLQPNDGDPNMIYTSFVVKGSNESRPRISIGDVIRFRVSRESFPQLASSIPPIFPFELVGIVTDYTLATEMVGCQLLFPRAVHIMQNVQIPFNAIANISNQILDVLQNITYHIRFSFPRIGMDYIKDALSTIHADASFSDVLFPSANLLKSLADDAINFESTIAPGRTSRVKNADSFTFNEEQQHAIDFISNIFWRSTQSILIPPHDYDITLPGLGYTGDIFLKVSLKKSSSKIRCPPFIIHGPPGTGKTSTLIESIRLLAALHPMKQLLACAPSDAAADILCLRLTKFFSKSKLLRLNWWQRSVASVPSELYPYCHSTNGSYEMLDAQQISMFQIVVCTVGSAGALRYCLDTSGINSYRQGLQCLFPLFFDVVVIDEASQATEAELLVPVALCKPNGLIVLAGDPHQLGADVRSPLYRISGKIQSLQERLMKLDFYVPCTPGYSLRSDKKPTDFPFGVFLSKNYRSHPCMLDVPSRLFYSGALESCASQIKVDSLLSWSFLPKDKDFPMLFVGVNGQHYHDIDSPSFFNLAEVSKIVEVVSSLLTEFPKNLLQVEIGVIGAFRSQVLMIRKALRAVGYRNVSVGGVEDFQGQEMRVIILSTVLSSRVSEYEREGALGLVNDDRRFNVATTRGIALVVAIGHPYYLHAADRNWREFMEYCSLHEAYSGHRCRALKSDILEENNDQDLLDSIAHFTALGQGVEDQTSYDTGGSMFKNYDMPWRLAL